MLTIGPLAFALPWMLVALAILPVIWWLLQVTPPAPRRIIFPAIRLLFGLAAREETLARTPWWLMLLRLFLAALIIVALARPLINPGARLAGDGTLLFVVDNGWSAGGNWADRSEMLATLIEQAERTDRIVAVMTTAAPAEGGPIEVSNLMPARDARQLIEKIVPVPWPIDRAAALAALKDVALPGPVESIWLSDGLINDGSAAATKDLAETLMRLGPASIILDEAVNRAKLLPPPDTTGAVLTATVHLPLAALAETEVTVRAITESGQVLARAPAQFEAGTVSATAEFDLPSEARNKIVRLEIEGEGTAGAVVLLDERWRRRPVGLVSGGSLEQAQPLLSDTYYLGRALEPTAALHTGNLDDLIDAGLAVLILADVGQVVISDRDALTDWMDRGGVLVRFAGPKLAESDGDLLPVELRRGTRGLSGALTWTVPLRLGAFGEESPFFGLDVPDDVLVSRQILAEPALDLNDRTWARLADGTPLVTAQRKGQGWLVMFHVTATPAWSNLPLSGLFVEMMQRVVALSQGVSGARESEAIPPLRLLDGFGQLGAPGPGARPAPPEIFDDAKVGPGHAPGFYGQTESRRALNLSAGLEPPRLLDDVIGNMRREAYGTSAEFNLLPWLLVAAMITVMIDILAGMILAGQLRRSVGSVASIALALFIFTAIDRGANAQGSAQGNDSFALDATLDTRLAYAITGDPAIDEMSRAGLTGLSQMLTLRTAIEPALPMAVNVETDELAFFALIYWPIDPGQVDLSPEALAKIDAYMKNGGTILFDTRDQQYVQTSPTGRQSLTSANGPGAMRLREILAGLDIPPLVPVPSDHVLTKAFYLLTDFPGRWDGGTLWVQRHAGGSNDGVSSIIIGANDFAAAWALDETGRAIAAVVPGGANQREMAFRFGINLMMYAHTGNYKADQVHIPAILERLGQ